ncbi:winged helix-turn-helix domain-containing protein [Pseudonocardia sp. RS11V-5]|uniref:BTAD domain-containing putative transcriptional regulator n=1 Tax=Pseudonocardia terrae TaxID=2905831 RepID=UPI001E4EF660|nr:BTAD domain-containing putative transcriptional regulator [Pseudonocardia terrae]MCE3555558.1 winged helix-turn-helix domain-containing protein [Pseudonocardia terrae]
MIDVQLLGPVAVVVDGRARDVGRSSERALLALLALHAGTVVSTARLIDDLWGEQLPDDPANALQTRVSKLRRALTTAGVPGVVATRSPGYVLDVAPDRVDAFRAAELVEQARRTADPHRAEELHTAALALWHGEPLAEFADEGWAAPERARLQELRLTAIEERAALRAATGRDAEVLAEVEPLAAAHPLRERLRGLQMTALYRAGRQAEALAVYADLRRALAEQLGLDPSPELEALHEAVLRRHPDLAPRTAPSPRPPSTLPVRLTTVLGRADELEHVALLCRDRRLVTLTGPGGAGKTTLATEAARTLADRFPDGVVLVELAGVTDPARVPAAVVDALGLAGDAAVDPVERLIGALRGRSLLLVVDNCEHVVDACAVLVERLLAGCPSVHVLASSREPLAVPGEVQLPVRPLPVPPPDAGPAELAANVAVRLFAERAWTVDPRFVLDGATLGPVAEICRRLDGLPLALELAAARVAVLSPAQIAERLSDRFALLTSGARTAAARHRTLQATLDWSHALLDADEQVLLRRLAVFRGGWTLEEAETTCAGDPLPAGAVLDVLGRLVARSLVVDARTGDGRFRMLETVRAYAARRLDDAGERAEVERRHAEAVLAVAEAAAPRLRGADQHRALARLRAERDNIDAALTWAVEHAAEAPDVALRLVGALGWWWYFGRHDEGRRAVDAVLGAVVGGAPAARAVAHQAASLVWRPGACVVHPDPRCAREAAASLAAAEETGAEATAAYARILVAVEGTLGTDPAGAEGLLTTAEQALRRAGDEWGLALATFVRAEIGFRTGSVPFAEAERLAERAAAAFARLDDRWGRSAVLGHHGTAVRMAGRIPEAVRLIERSARLATDLGLLLTLQWMQAELAYCALVEGDRERALARCAEAEETTRQLGAGPGAAFAALVRGIDARQRGDLAAARTALAPAVEQLTTAGIGGLAAALTVQLGHAHELSGDLAAAERAHRRALELGGGVVRAAAVEGLACVAVARGDARSAARLLGVAAAERERTGRPADAVEQGDLDRATAGARAELGAPGFAEAHAEGLRTGTVPLPEG